MTDGFLLLEASEDKRLGNRSTHTLMMDRRLVDDAEARLAAGDIVTRIDERDRASSTLPPL